MQRKLTVIVSADVVAYSALMERDEAGTLERLKSNREDIFDPRVVAHGGRIVKLMGDGALVEFASVVSAVNCAHEIQAATEADRGAPELQRIRYRIGITLGDVIVDGDDIYGDGVNAAAWLQSLAPPGGVAVSRTVRDQAMGKVAVEFDDLGEHTVKNLERPIHVFAMRAASNAPASAAEQPRQRMWVQLVTSPGDTGWDAAERALALAPDLAEAHPAKGRVLGDAGRYDESLAEHGIALSLDPDAYEVNAAAARCFIALRRYPEAIRCLEKAAAAIETDFWALGMSISCHKPCTTAPACWTPPSAPSSGWRR